MATKLKPKRYADGSVVEGPNANIDDDTRARARAWVAKQMSGEGDTEAPTAKPSRAAAPAPKAAKPAKPEAPAAKPAKPEAPAAKTASGPTDDELDKYAKRRKAEEFVPNAGKYQDSPEPGKPMFIPAGAGIGRGADVLRRAGTALAERFDKITPIANRARSAAQDVLEGPSKSGPALAGPSGKPSLPGPSEAPRVGRTTAEALPAPKVEPVELPKEAVKAPAKKAPKKKPSPRNRTKFNDDEAGTEFSKGGSVRGWGKARGGRKAKIR